ncbi:efflux RND transporter periplasmic adaptor subunit [Neorhizobium sp. P12A]|uniref:efflux RND transporter periplasmic adaptor subunit n=1 Tax=Rhizobium/Agrobacterium group TaxID=227290 RepID=UPI00104C6433|nr:MULTISPECIES: efflux RND transporter periplasmic adaptor subunit [Rhizobium/Agrobacterium group]KAA0697149.1 efflux RND transporter periplasmic adaptor subunit [Neorhizobium sp. P12A]TCR86003.1 membrane fusion protein (multidrug efflux system) [Rhizobium sp. BK376]
MRVLVSLSSVVAAAAAVMLAPSAFCQEAATTAAPPPPPTVTVALVTEKDIRPSSSFTGRVVAVDKVDLRARVDGFLEKTLFKEGQDVKPGDLLFSMEKGQFQAAVEQAQGNLEAAEASVSLADIEVKRQSDLVAKNAGTQQALDLANAKKQGSAGTAEQLRAALAQAELNLGYTDISAPIAGRIGRAAYSVGNFIGPSSNVLATIVSQDPIYVNFTVSQREMLGIREKYKGAAADALVNVQLADGTTYPQGGKIDFVDVSVNQGTDTVVVRASFANPDRVLVDGQLVNVTVKGDQAQSALVIPQSAIQIDQAGPYVLVVNKDKKIEVRYLQPGQMEGSDVSITKGLSAGEMVVTEGIQKVRPGQAVEPVVAKSGS